MKQNYEDILGYELVQTSFRCPEQYDVLKGGEKVGYLRLRHGWFRADVPDVGGVTVYENTLPGNVGWFEDHERMAFLTAAVEAIDRHLTSSPGAGERKAGYTKARKRCRSGHGR